MGVISLFIPLVVLLRSAFYTSDKIVLMMFSGLLFLVLYFVIHKNLMANENIKWWIVLINLIFFGLFQKHYFKKKTYWKRQTLSCLSWPLLIPALMQGDYMSLRYKISEASNLILWHKQGYRVVKQDANGIAKKQHFQNEKSPSADELLIKITTMQINGTSTSELNLTSSRKVSPKNTKKPNMAVSE